MEPAQILFATLEDGFLFKLTGELRNTHTGSFATSLQLNHCVERLLERRAETILVDLTEVTSIDSTHLGLVAHIGARHLESTGQRAVLLSTRSEITRLLRSMAMHTIFELVESTGLERGEAPLQHAAAAEGNAAEVALTAHRALAALSGENHAAFRQLIDLLEAQQHNQD
jgi:anti-anti-sigma factor